MADSEDFEECGFCTLGVYRYGDDSEGECPYCEGTGKQVPIQSGRKGDGRG